MANPNIAALSTINGNTSLTALSTTSATSVASNASASGKVFKVESIMVSNNTGTAANITISVYSAASIGGTAYQIVGTQSVPAYSTLSVVDKTNAFYLLEDKSIGATAGTANAFTVVASWEEIS